MYTKENNPYVVSADAGGLFKGWSEKNQITIPNESYFEGMLKDLECVLKEYFESVDILPEEFLRSGLNTLVRTSKNPVISLDRAYVNSQQENLVGFLDATRLQNSNLQPIGLGGRALKLSLDRQIGQIATKYAGKEIALVDDVIFNGDTILTLVNKLKSLNVKIENIFSGITIKSGKELLKQNGIQVTSLLEYDSVEDEVCERDFVVGAPYSGRSVIAESGELQGAPYLLPFGRPTEWGSIPLEQASNFSDFCLYQAIQLWQKIEQLSNRTISTESLDRQIFNLPKNNSIVDALQTITEQKKETL